MLYDGAIMGPAVSISNQFNSPPPNRGPAILWLTLLDVPRSPYQQWRGVVKHLGYLFGFCAKLK